MRSMNHKTRALALLLAVLLSLAGCGTINDMTKGDDGQRVYGGIRQDAGMIQSNNSTPVVLGILDFPFSFALDTAMLPITFIIMLIRGGK